MVFETKCGAVPDFQMENNAEKGQKRSLQTTLEYSWAPFDLPKLPKSPEDPTVTPKEAQYHPSTGLLLASPLKTTKSLLSSQK